MKTILIFLIGLLVGVGSGNLRGDQATLRDCATKGQANMRGGGTITCKVQPQEVALYRAAEDRLAALAQ